MDKLTFHRPLYDYAGRKLCDPCWNGNHKYCIDAICECLCRRLAKEKQQQRRTRRTAVETIKVIQ